MSRLAPLSIVALLAACTPQANTTAQQVVHTAATGVSAQASASASCGIYAHGLVDTHNNKISWDRLRRFADCEARAGYHVSITYDARHVPHVSTTFQK